MAGGTGSVDGLRVAVRVRPGAGRTRVGGSHPGPRGPALLIAVAAPAVDGRANAAAIRALAQALGVRPAQIALCGGATGRDKLFEVRGDPAVLGARVRALLGPSSSDAPVPPPDVA